MPPTGATKIVDEIGLRLHRDHSRTSPLAVRLSPTERPRIPTFGYRTALDGKASPQTSPKSCCETGRPIATDPATGHTICSCQCGPSLIAGYTRLPGLPEAMYPHHTAQPYTGALHADPAALYQAITAGYALKDGASDAWRSIYQPLTCYPYDPAMATVYPGAGYSGVDINGSRRKNATRESTSTLKAWLQEHIKNPYPTKGEKIMLAIITKMTLTQVSTWFANARRRLKKENKMTWSPRNRCDDDDDDGADSDVDPTDDVMEKQSRDAESPLVSLVSPEVLSPSSPVPRDADDIPSTSAPSPDVPVKSQTASTATTKREDDPDKPVTKPKIWSLADTATSVSSPPARRSPIIRHGLHPYFSSMPNSLAKFSTNYLSRFALPYEFPYARHLHPSGFEMPLSLATLQERSPESHLSPTSKASYLDAKHRILSITSHSAGVKAELSRPSDAHVSSADHGEGQLSR